MAASPEAVAAAGTGGLSALVQQTAEQFGVNWPDLLAQMISFLIVALLLRQFAFKPLLRLLDERRQRLADSLRDAEAVRAERDRAEAERRDVLDAARAEADRILGEARQAAEALAERARRRAEAAAAEIVARAGQEAQAEQARLRTALRHELGALVVQATTAVTGRTLTADDQERLCHEGLRELSA